MCGNCIDSILRCEIALGQSLKDMGYTSEILAEAELKVCLVNKIFKRPKGQILTRSSPLTIEYDIMIPHFSSSRKLLKNYTRSGEKGDYARLVGHTSFLTFFF